MSIKALTLRGMREQTMTIQINSDQTRGKTIMTMKFRSELKDFSLEINSANILQIVTDFQTVALNIMKFVNIKNAVSILNNVDLFTCQVIF